MKVHAVKCLRCGDILFSRTVHDYRSCTCGKTHVDGGFDYLKLGFEPYSKEELKKRVSWFRLVLYYISFSLIRLPFIVPCDYVSLEVSLDRNDLYRDWALGEDKYGLFNLANGLPNYITGLEE